MRRDLLIRKWARTSSVIGIAVLLLILACAKRDNAVPASDIGRMAVCPVTGDTFTITKNTPFLDYNGERIYFCCPGCDKNFMADPEKYLKKDPMSTMDSGKTESRQEEAIRYYTCSMHPSVRSDKPGDCPICGMELIPVYEGPESRIEVDEKMRLAMNILSEPARMRILTKRIHAPGRVAGDDELYLAQQEYLSVRSFGGEIERSAKLKLRLMGLSDKMIDRIASSGKADESLILPAPHRAWLFADIYEKDFPIVKPGSGVEITFNSYPGRTFSGTIQAIEPNIEPRTRSSTARILLEHPMVSLSVGMYGDVQIDVPLGEVLSVPLRAVIDTGKRLVVYVEVGNDRYEPRRVMIGTETDEYAEVLEGLTAGENVVTDGNFLLDSQTTIAGGQTLLYGAAEEVKQETSPAVHQH